MLNQYGTFLVRVYCNSDDLMNQCIHRVLCCARNFLQTASRKLALTPSSESRSLTVWIFVSEIFDSNYIIHLGRWRRYIHIYHHVYIRIHGLVLIYGINTTNCIYDVGHSTFPKIVYYIRKVTLGKRLYKDRVCVCWVRDRGLHELLSHVCNEWLKCVFHCVVY